MATHESHEGTFFLGVPDAVYICGTVYLKTPAAGEALRHKFAEAGYVLNEEGTRARLEGINFVECHHCRSIISSFGVAAHGHPCDSCGKPTMLEYNQGEIMRFYFIRAMEPVTDTLTFRIHEYRQDAEEIAFYAGPLTRETPGFEAKALDAKTDKAAHDMLVQAAALYRREKKIDPDGLEIDLIVVPFSNPGLITDKSHINTERVDGAKVFYSPVRVFNGKVYHFMDEFPVPEGVSLSDEYADGSKLPLSRPDAHEIILRSASLVSRIDYYHQDGRMEVYETFFKRMDAFVKHFVDVEYEEWSRFKKTAPLDGPGFINALAKWCARQSDNKPRAVRDEPNMWNVVAAVAKRIEGKPLSYQEIVAAEDGLSDLEDKFGRKKPHPEMDKLIGYNFRLPRRTP